MEIRGRAEGRRLTVYLSGELDQHAARETMEAVDRCIERNLPSTAVLDLGGVTFMDSSGIAVVLRARRRMEALDGRLAVANVPAQAARVLEAAGLRRYVELI